MIILGFKQFVPSLVCLSCDGCCRFKEAENIWQPKVGLEEIERAQQNGLAKEIFAKAVSHQGGSIKTTPCGDGHCCSFFNRNDNTCRIYEHRPFECQLYPFLLAKRDSNIYLAVHHLCPFVQKNYDTSVYREYTQYLKNFFDQEDTLQFVRRNASIAGDYAAYQGEIEYLFKIT